MIYRKLLQCWHLKITEHEHRNIQRPRGGKELIRYLYICIIYIYHLSLQICTWSFHVIARSQARGFPFGTALPPQVEVLFPSRSGFWWIMVKLKYKLELWLENRYCNSFNDILRIMTEWYKDVRMCIIYTSIRTYDILGGGFKDCLSLPLGMMIEFAIFFRLKSPPHICTLSINSFRGSFSHGLLCSAGKMKSPVSEICERTGSVRCLFAQSLNMMSFGFIHGQSFKGLAFHGSFFFRKGPSTWRSWKTDQAVEWGF